MMRLSDLDYYYTYCTGDLPLHTPGYWRTLDPDENNKCHGILEL